MNEIILESRTEKIIINIPPFDGVASFRLQYKHELEKSFPHSLMIKLTPTLHLEEIGGPRKFKITDAVCKYRVKINDKLTAADLAPLWHESASYIINAFNNFELQKFGKKSTILIDSLPVLETAVQQHVDWFYNALLN